MFTQARIKLTIQYVTIIMLVSIVFSVAVYRILTQEIRRGFRMRIYSRGEIYRPPLPSDGTVPFLNFLTPTAPVNDENILEEINQRIASELVLVNLGIFVLSAVSAYLLAGRTLAPIEQMVDEQKRFIADASHELRTPLTALKTEIEVAMRDKALKLTEAKKLLSSNLEEVDKLNSLAGYLLTLSRYQNQTQLKFSAVKLIDLTAAAVKNVQRSAQAKKIMIDTQIPDLTVHAHGFSLTEVLTILLDNAVKYSHPQGKVVVRAQKFGKGVKIEVEDYGVGIKASDLPYIFNRFYRADSSRNKTQTDGYGLGLSIAKNILELHQGKIEVVSALNKGSIFRVVLPQR